MAGSDGADDLFDLGGDDVALEELLIVEDLAEDALGEEMLDEHFADGIVGEVGVDGLAAEFGEGGEVFAEGGVLAELVFEDFGYAVGEVGDLGGELGNGIFPVDFVGLLVFEEEFEDFDELFRGGDGVVEDDAAVLVEDGVAGGLEEDVGEGVAGVAFAGDLFGKVVVGVFGFPEAVDEGEVVHEGAVCAEGLFGCAFELVLLDEVPAVGGAAALEEVGEGGAGVAFGGVAVFGEGGEGFEVGFDGLV